MNGYNPAPNGVYAALAASLVLIYLTFRRLEIVVDTDGVTLSYWWIRRNIPFHDVSSFEITNVTPAEHGGLGLR